MASANKALNPGSKETPYFTPQHAVSPGTPYELTANTPTLFTPLKIRDVTLRNRIIVAPMCQYSTAAWGPEIGALTAYHLATLGHYALKGAALVFVEATGVQPNGRISPNCPGLWQDAQIEPLRKVSDFIKSQGAVSAIQLAHAGRKGSTAAPWLSSRERKVSVRAPSEVGGWPDDVVGPTGGDSWDGKSLDEEGGFYPPRELSAKDIQQLVRDFAAAAERAVKAGVQVIEIHGAHGYLIHQFLSPVTNRRTDQYGGSLENRTRILFDIIKAVRDVIPAGMPLMLRLSATEWLENTELGKKYGCWDVESTLYVAKRLPEAGIDLLDVSSGGNHPQQQINMFASKDYQVRIAARIRHELRLENKELLIGAVGLITEPEQARDIVDLNRARDAAGSKQEESSTEEEALAALKLTDAKAGEPLADAVLVARQFMREPEWVLKAAWKLGVDVAWPSQFLRVRFPKL